MNITESELWEAVNFIHKTERDVDIDLQKLGFVLPKALERCAVIMVRDEWPTNTVPYAQKRLKFEKQVKAALIELKETGMLQC